MESAPTLAAAPVMVTPAPLQVQAAVPASPTRTEAVVDVLKLGSTYTDAELGLAFDYPAAWRIERQEQQSRGSFVQLVGSEGDLDDFRMQLTVLNWDPKQDLEAFLEVRRTAWESLGARFRRKAIGLGRMGFRGKLFS